MAPAQSSPVHCKTLNVNHRFGKGELTYSDPMDAAHTKMSEEPPYPGHQQHWKDLLKLDRCSPSWLCTHQDRLDQETERGTRPYT